jgi:hypothetical protein
VLVGWLDLALLQNLYGRRALVGEHLDNFYYLENQAYFLYGFMVVGQVGSSGTAFFYLFIHCVPELQRFYLWG